MALPEQVVDRLSHEPVRTPGWSGQLLMFSATIFFISIAVYGGIVFGYKPYLEKQISDFNAQINDFSKKIPTEEQNKLVSFYSQIVNLKGILRQHSVSSQLLEWLEKNTVVSVYYNKMDFSLSSGQLNLTGYSKTVDDFSKQLIVFQNDPIVQRIAVNGLTISTNNMWQFNINLFLNNAIVNQSTTQQ
ncbi:MAG: hypothetical protein Q8O66_02885 [bacterium]|nr:hypothetical protein [bacterium]